MDTSAFSTARQLLFLLRKIHISPAYFLVPILLSIGAATFEGVGMSLLIPMLSGFLQKDFSFLTQLPVLSTLIGWLPDAVSQSDRLLFVTLLGFFIAVIVLKNVLRFAASVSMSYLGTRTVHHLRKQVFNAYLGFGKLFFDTSNVGHHSTVLSQFTTEALQPLLNVDRFIHALFSLIAYMVVMTLISWKLTLVAIPLFIILHWSVRRMIKKIVALSRKSVDQASELGKKVIEILSTMPLVKAFNMEEEERRLYTDISDERAMLEYRTNVYRQLIGPFQELITLAAVLLLLSGMLYLLVHGGSTSPPSFLVYFYLVVNATNKFGAMTGFQSNLAAAAGPIREVMQVFDRADKHIVPEGGRTFRGLEQGIAFRDLHFSYMPGKEVLRGLTLEIPRGKMTAIVGPTGAGKTTIISLLLRYYDCPPHTLTLDGADIRTFSIASLRDHMALVSQEVLLLHDSLRHNITYGISDVPEKQLRDAVRRARLEEFVRSLPQGIDTLIGDRGVRLSGGEKQRVSIARALLKGADILLLDEATSSLDSHTERLIQEAIEDAIRGKTAIVIAHRLSTIQHADRIAVLEDGRCVEEGSLDALLAKKGRFAGYWEEQKFS